MAETAVSERRASVIRDRLWGGLLVALVVWPWFR